MRVRVFITTTHTCDMCVYLFIFVFFVSIDASVLPFVSGSWIKIIEFWAGIDRRCKSGIY